MLAGLGKEFKQVCILTGHADWIRSLAFTYAAPPEADSSAGEPCVSSPPPAGNEGLLQGLLQGLLSATQTSQLT